MLVADLKWWLLITTQCPLTTKMASAKQIAVEAANLIKETEMHFHLINAAIPLARWCNPQFIELPIFCCKLCVVVYVFQLN